MSKRSIMRNRRLTSFDIASTKLNHFDFSDLASESSNDEGFLKSFSTSSRILTEPENTATKKVVVTLKIDLGPLPDDDDETFWSKTQGNTLARWVRAYLTKTQAQEFRTLSSGFDSSDTLITLLEVLTFRSIPWISRSDSQNDLKHTNLKMAINYAKRIGIKLQTTEEQILEHNEKSIRIMVWQLAMFHLIQRYHQTKITPKELVLKWANSILSNYDITLNDFDESLRDGRVFCAILHHSDNSLLDFKTITKENAKENLQKALDLADYLGVTKIITTQEIISGKADHHSLTLYLFELFKKFHTFDQVLQIFKESNVSKKIIKQMIFKGNNRSSSFSKSITSSSLNYSQSKGGSLTPVLKERKILTHNRSLRNFNKISTVSSSENEKKIKQQIAELQKKSDEKIVELYNRTKNAEMESEKLRIELEQLKSINPNRIENNLTKESTLMEEKEQEYITELRLLNKKYRITKEQFEEQILEKDEQIDYLQNEIEKNNDQEIINELSDTNLNLEYQISVLEEKLQKMMNSNSIDDFYNEKELDQENIDEKKQQEHIENNENRIKQENNENKDNNESVNNILNGKLNYLFEKDDNKIEKRYIQIIEEQQQEIDEIFYENEKITQEYTLKFQELTEKNANLEKKLEEFTNNNSVNKQTFDQERIELMQIIDQYEKKIDELENENKIIKNENNLLTTQSEEKKKEIQIKSLNSTGNNNGNITDNSINVNNNNSQNIKQINNQGIENENLDLFQMNEKLKQKINNLKIKKQSQIEEMNVLQKENEDLKRKIEEENTLFDVNKKVHINEIDKISKQLNESQKTIIKMEEHNNQKFVENQKLEKIINNKEESLERMKDQYLKLKNEFTILENKNNFEIKELTEKLERSNNQQKMLQNSNQQKSRDLEELESKIENELEVLKEIVDDLKEKLESKKKFKRSKKKKKNFLEEMDYAQMKLMYEQQSSLVRQKQMDYNSLSQMLNKKFAQISEFKKKIEFSKETEVQLTNEIRTLRETINELKYENQYYRNNNNSEVIPSNEKNVDNDNDDDNGNGKQQRQQQMTINSNKQLLSKLREKDEQLKNLMVKMELLKQIKGENVISDERSNEIIVRLANSLADAQLKIDKLEKKNSEFEKNSKVSSQNDNSIIDQKMLFHEHQILIKELDRLDSLVF
ncbi:protein-methionine sulfoxide oxidase mical-like protein [Anaeramoeba flamelloides]|uniref:Protein-methionine sulfoxide oxidase mical-like protein n=1 Tax=Anaeramoeba flamelloides TaxID=1746091 RepID=A0AAV7YI51_9EUKA|nr:protein-methionine sulfoxide oxidase mical-like protein [Anaeramoeba flamelloides]